MKSIIQSEKQCFVPGCKCTDLHEHHIFFAADRKTSEKFGLKVWLCLEHHEGDYSPHHNKEFDDELKRIAQIEFLKLCSIAEWMDIKKGIGRNYL